MAKTWGGVEVEALNLKMPTDVIRKLKHFAIDDGRTCSEIVAELIARHVPPAEVAGGASVAKSPKSRRAS